MKNASSEKLFLFLMNRDMSLKNEQNKEILKKKKFLIKSS